MKNLHQHNIKEILQYTGLSISCFLSQDQSTDLIKKEHVKQEKNIIKKHLENTNMNTITKKKRI